jgi:large subunit ribosomal protein L25
MAATIIAAPRSESGKGAARVLRREGRVPAIMYGHGDATRSISVDAHELEKLLASINIENTLIDVQVEGGETTRALIREVQWHPYKRFALHLDFYQVHAGESLKLDVPIRVVGTPAGVRDQGGVLQQTLHELHIECLPRHIPDTVELDVSHLSIGDSISVRDVEIANVTITNDPDLAICSVVGPTVVSLPEDEVAEDETAEPEVIGRGGEAEGEGAGGEEQGD